MKRILFTLVFAMVLTVVSADPSFAYQYGDKGDRTGSQGCNSCHTEGKNGDKNPNQNTAPHGNYTSTSDNCSACHKVHTASGANLLPATTLSQTCNYCHDYTQSDFAVYRLNRDVDENTPEEDLLAKSGHRVVGVNYYQDYMEFEGTNVVPGGNDATGGTATLITSKDGSMANADNALSCSSCHSPHGLNVVDKYIGESNRNYSPVTNDKDGWIFPSSKILRSKLYGPNEETPTTIAQYGGAWCAACHQGRDNDLQDFHNHKVDLDKAWGWGNQTVDLLIGNNNSEDPRKNNVFVMIATEQISATETKESVDGTVPYAAPSCQQCHASARDVRDAFSGVNPEQQYRNFPHQSTNKKLLVEQKDNLCLNCHGQENLP